jgi:REP element-mobilizing transposase RayT
MTYNPEIHHRRSIRLQEYDYSQNGAYFITICTQNRQNIFGTIVGAGSARPGLSRPGSARPCTTISLNKFGEIVREEWYKLSSQYPHVEFREFVIMPNHFHGILVIAKPGQDKPGRADPAPTGLGRIVAYFKYRTTKMIDLPEKLWQRNYYEHIIRDERDYLRCAEYIVNNPMNWKNDRLWGESENFLAVESF